MNRAACAMALAASGVIRGSAWKTCTWSGHTCSSQLPPRGADLGGEMPRIRLQHFGAAGLDQCRRKRGPPATSSAQAVVGGIDALRVQADQAGGVGGAGSRGRGASVRVARARAEA